MTITMKNVAMTLGTAQSMLMTPDQLSPEQMARAKFVVATWRARRANQKSKAR